VSDEGVCFIDNVQQPTEESDSDFQRGTGRWTSKSDHRTRTCVVIRLKRNQVVEILCRLVCCENLIC